MKTKTNPIHLFSKEKKDKESYFTLFFLKKQMICTSFFLKSAKKPNPFCKLFARFFRKSQTLFARFFLKSAKRLAGRKVDFHGQTSHGKHGVQTSHVIKILEGGFTGQGHIVLVRDVQ
jgi:hypothetical protein